MNKTAQQIVRDRAKAAGSLSALAQQTGLDVASISRIAAGKQQPGRKALKALGLKTRVVYLTDD